MKTSALPHQTDDLFLTDGGLETTLVFIEGYELPFFAAFDLLKDEKGTAALKNYYEQYLKIAADFKTRFILESPTWRANPDWIEKIGYPIDSIQYINKKAVHLMMDLKHKYDDGTGRIIVSGCVGPRGDGYKVENKMSAAEAKKYHMEQIKIFSQTPVDVITAVTINYIEEAIGIVEAANAVGFPSVISFTLETDGKLPSGMTLKTAIEETDKALTVSPIYYMINCAHPSHFRLELEKGLDENWTKRIRGIRANSSCKSHAELDESSDLDRGNPRELGIDNLELKKLMTHLNVFGGCCGTDSEHLVEIAKNLTKLNILSV